MTLRIYTKTGDAGETGLFGGLRVAKDDLRVEAYGTVDELNACLGQARAAGCPPDLDAALSRVQSLLFALGAELATPPERLPRPVPFTARSVVDLENLIDRFDGELPALRAFILPAGTAASATLHVARAVCRRAERRCVHLRTAQPSTALLTVTFLNRLGDLLFVMARLANHRAGIADVPWIADTSDA